MSLLKTPLPIKKYVYVRPLNASLHAIDRFKIYSSFQKSGKPYYLQQW